MGKAGKGCKHIERCQVIGGPGDPLTLEGHPLADFLEQRILELGNSLLCAKNLFLIFLEFRSDVSLGICQSLLSHIVRRNILEVCLGNL